MNGTGEVGSAVVEFVLIAALLVPIFTLIVSLGVRLHVNNTVTSIAADAARSVSGLDRDIPAAQGRVGQVVAKSSAKDHIRAWQVQLRRIGGVCVVEVVIEQRAGRAGVLPLPGRSARGHAVCQDEF